LYQSTINKQMPCRCQLESWEGKKRSISSKIEEAAAYTFVNSSHSPVMSYLT